ncbi:MAG: biotin--[Clostridia bacterium]|nr:biotin--[acetyl-CoA-carboxylase] ligase [Clostridia bacterium]
MSQQLCADALRQYLKHVQSAVDVRVFETIDSTNNEAKRMCLDGYAGRLLLAADRQSGGRGRMGRSFYSPAQTGAYFSILYTPVSPLFSAVSVTGAAAVAVMRAIRDLTGKQTQIKWVNDLYLDDKKVCGILAEAVSQGAQTQVIVGIGINLTTKDFPQELSAIAGALGGDAVDRERLIAAVYEELEPYLEDPADRSYLAEYRAHSAVLGREITWSADGTVKRGIATAIDDDGALLVRAENGREERLFSGEISVRIQGNQK